MCGCQLVAVLQVYRHIVLAVHDPQSGLFGGLGISRRDSLMFKTLTFRSLAELIQDYIKAYRYSLCAVDHLNHAVIP